MKITVNEEKLRSELGRPAGVVHGDPMKLKPSEIQVLALWLGGRVPKEIASEIGKSWQYVNNLFHTIKQKMSVRDQLELAYLAYERGYVVIEEGA